LPPGTWGLLDLLACSVVPGKPERSFFSITAVMTGLFLVVQREPFFTSLFHFVPRQRARAFFIGPLLKAPAQPEWRHVSLRFPEPYTPVAWREWVLHNPLQNICRVTASANASNIPRLAFRLRCQQVASRWRMNRTPMHPRLTPAPNFERLPITQSYRNANSSCVLAASRQRATGCQPCPEVRGRSSTSLRPDAEHSFGYNQAHSYLLQRPKASSLGQRLAV